MRILIVDDERDVSEVLRRYFEAKGHAIATAATAEQAVDLAGRQRYDAVLLDNSLPGTMGMQAVARLKGTGAAVVLMSGHFDEDVRQDARALGAFDALAKPLDLRVVESVLADAVSGAR